MSGLEVGRCPDTSGNNKLTSRPDMQNFDTLDLQCIAIYVRKMCQCQGKKLVNVQSLAAIKNGLASRS